MTKDQQSFGMCVVATESQAAAEAIVRADPAVAEGVMSASVFPFHVALLTRAAHAARPTNE
jgi:uncharacterized protein YciI